MAKRARTEGVESVHKLCDELGLKPREHVPAPRRRRPYRTRQPKTVVVAKEAGFLERERAQNPLGWTAEQRIAATAAQQREESERRKRLELEQANLSLCDKLGAEALEDGGGRWCWWEGALCIRTNGDHDHPFANTRGVTGVMCPTPLGPLMADIGRWRVWKYMGHLPELKRQVEHPSDRLTKEL